MAFADSSEQQEESGRAAELIVIDVLRLWCENQNNIPVIYRLITGKSLSRSSYPLARLRSCFPRRLNCTRYTNTPVPQQFDNSAHILLLYYLRDTSRYSRNEVDICIGLKNLTTYIINFNRTIMRSVPLRVQRTRVLAILYLSAAILLEILITLIL